MQSRHDAPRCPTTVLSDSHLRVAILGAGKMGLHHARAVERLGDRARLVGIVDPSARALEGARAALTGVALAPSLDALLAEHAVDVVHVCTPPDVHETGASAALAKGCHVYVEKPFAPSVEVAERLYAQADAAGLHLTAGHQLLFEAPARRLRELLPALGDIAHIESYFSFRPVRRTPDGRVPQRPDLQLLDVLPHPVYLLLDFLERVAPGERTRIASLELGADGTVHALVRRGPVSGTLVVTLSGRPVESTLRIVGSNGSACGDFVRGIVCDLVGPGTSGIDKALAPYRTAIQLVARTTTALAARALRRQVGYPGLAEAFASFYDGIRAGRQPITSDQVLGSVRIWREVADAIEAMRHGGRTAVRTAVPRRAGRNAGPRVLVTGGTGFLGRPVVRALRDRGASVRVVSRRTPAPWDLEAGVKYVAGDVADALPAAALDGIDVVVHCAAETAGGWEEHERNSLRATERLLHAAADAGVMGVVHVSSLAVVGEERDGRPISETTPLEAKSRERGPYVWGKLESERIAGTVAAERGIALRVVRPGALVEWRRFDPPGRLGKRIGNLFVAVGGRGDRLGIVDVESAAASIAWMARHIEDAPDVINLLESELPTKRELVGRLRAANPGLLVVWLPFWLLVPLSLLARLAQRVLRPGRPTVDVARVFAVARHDVSRSAELARRVKSEEAPGPEPAASPLAPEWKPTFEAPLSVG